MSFLSSITSAITDPGKLVSEVADSLLPSSMKGIGEAIGGIVDLNTGHPLQALSHLSDALKDLPQLMGQSGAAAKAAATPAGTAAAEPSPPPSRTTTTNASASTPAAGATPATSSAPAPAVAPAAGTPSAQAPAVTVTKSGGESITKVDDGTNSTLISELNGHTNVTVRSDATGALLRSFSGSGNNISMGGGQGPHVTVTNKGGETVTTVDNGTSTAMIDDKNGSSNISVARDGGILAEISAALAKMVPANGKTGTSGGAAASTTAATPAAPTAAPAPATSGTAATTAPAPAGASGTAPAAAASTTTANATSSAASSSSGANSAATSGTSSSSTNSSTTAPKDLASLMALSPDQFTQAVTSGKIPDDVANSQSAMMQVQARMNQITQMNQLVTGMMAALHQMQMSIIQNIRC